MKWNYKTKAGDIVGHVLRLEDTDKLRKAIIPYFKEGGEAGIPECLPSIQRIYGLDSIADKTQPIFVVEGEKCAAALHGLGYQAVTSLGSLGQVNMADWSFLAEAKEVYLLPDNDQTGFKYMGHIYQHVRNVPFVRVLNVGLFEKADICDYFKSLPCLDDWDEFESLDRHERRTQIKNAFEQYCKSNVGEVPASWRFITTKHKHKLIAVNDFSCLKLPPRHMLLFPWLPEGSINMIFADRGIGKTFFSLSCALALANGDEFLCYQAEKAVPVLYLDGEMQGTAIQKRLKELLGTRSTKAPLHLYTPDCQENDFTPDLGTAEGRDHINEMIDQADPKVIFIDNISTFDRTGNENEAESWAPIQEWAVQHRKKGRSIVFVHHANKEGKQRGSHKKEDVMDAVIKLKRPDDYIQGEGGTKILIQYTKARHLSGDQAQDIEATLYSEAGALKWSWEQGDILYSKTIAMLKDGVSIRDIADELAIGKSTVHRWKKRAQSENLL